MLQTRPRHRALRDFLHFGSVNVAILRVSRAWIGNGSRPLELFRADFAHPKLLNVSSHSRWKLGREFHVARDIVIHNLPSAKVADALCSSASGVSSRLDFIAPENPAFV